MKYKEEKSMEEIHRIREKHYEETRGMSIHAKMRYIRKKARG